MSQSWRIAYNDSPSAIDRSGTADVAVLSFVNVTFAHFEESPIAKNQNTYAKRQREQEKKQRADQKRMKRDKKKDGVDVSAPVRELPFPAEDRSP